MGREYRFKCASCGDRVTAWREPADDACCRSCENAVQSRVSAARAKEIGLPDLAGSTAQVAWAETLRMTAYDRMTKVFPPTMVYSPRSEEKNTVENVVDLLGIDALAVALVACSETDAGAWIDNQRTLATFTQKAIMRVYGPQLQAAYRARLSEEERASLDAEESERKRLKDEKDAAARKASQDAMLLAANERAERDRKEAERTLLPETSVTSTKAWLKARPGIVSLKMAERHDGFNALIKGMSFRWNPDDKTWNRNVPSAAGTLLDVAANVGAALLAAGFPILVEPEVKAMILAGNFEAEHKRNVSIVDGGKHDGWLRMSWDRASDCYDLVKRIKGATYVKAFGCFDVPLSSADEVLDVAARHKFHVGKGVVERVAEYDRVAVVASVAKGKKFVPSDAVVNPAVPENLDVPVMEIADALRD